MVKVLIDSQPCYLAFSYKARQDFNDCHSNPQSFFALQDSFNVHIERTAGKDNEELYLQIYFDLQQNAGIEESFKEGVPNIRCVVKEKVLLVTSFNVSSKGYGGKNNRRISTKFHFFLEDSMTEPFPEELFADLKALPIEKERSFAVRSRLESWESYLTLQEIKSANNEVVLEFSAGRVKNNLKEMVVYSTELVKTKGKKLARANIKLVESGEEIGSLKKIDYSKNLIEIKLSEEYVSLLERNKWNPTSEGKIHISNYGDLAQVKRLRWGFRDLINGKSVNPNLENFLFEEQPLIAPSEAIEELDFNNKKLDIYQKKAVIGAMAANDLYLIQGPPGTGKTTVISEICYQNVKKGLKVLVASQSNLAVDNALSRLLVNPEIRILRKGRTTSIEEEGKKFIEENISDTWKQQTISIIQDDIKQLEAILNQKEQKLKDIERRLQKKKLEQQEIMDMKKRKAFLEKEKAKLVGTIRYYTIKEQNKLSIINTINKELQEIPSRLASLKEEIAVQQKLLDSGSFKTQLSETKKQLELKTAEYSKRLSLYKLQSAIKNYEEALCKTEKAIDRVNEAKDSILSVKKRIASNSYVLLKKDFTRLKKFDLVEEVSAAEKILIDYENLKSTHNTSTTTREFQELTKNLDFLIEKMEGLLNSYSYDTAGSKIYFSTAYHSNKVRYSQVEIRGMLDHYYSNHYSEPTIVEKFMSKLFNKSPRNLQLLIEDFRKTIEMKEYTIWKVQHIQEEQRKVEGVKEKVSTALNEYRADLNILYEKKLAFLQAEEESYKRSKEQKLSELEKFKYELLEREKENNIEKNLEMPLQELKKQIEILEREVAEFGTEKDYVATLEKIIFSKNNHIAEQKRLLESMQESFEKDKEDAANFQRLKEQSEMLLSAMEVELNVDLSLLEQDNEKEIFKLQQEKNYCSKDQGQQVQKQLAIKTDWLEVLRNSKEHDLEEIKKLYIKYANVIGITCVQSARKEFAEEYPDFDVVIIDEVSKATPPELLLPMLKGKKVILVGDHKQLPPLIGQDTLDETVENIKDLEKQNQVKAILKESLFERLFTTIPADNKITLKIQYRMHADIMETISQFYMEEEGVGLICGLTDSDAARDHRMQGKYVTRGQHLMWFDTPFEKAFFETKEANSTSTYNESELKIMYALLEDMEEAMAKGKEVGEIPADSKKQVGMISFYGDQVRKIEEMVEEKEFNHLVFRVGTVDRFQGIEMDVILASFVRNHNNSNDGIGFSKDFRRLNVALSRARELLVIIGSSQMFTQKSKNTAAKIMYTNVAKTVKAKHGLRDHRGLAK